MRDDFPSGTEEMWDVTAKALLLRDGGAVTISRFDLEKAAKAACEIELLADGSILFRLKSISRN